MITGGVPERPKGADCKSAGGAYGGSNPPPSTICLFIDGQAGVAQGLERQPSKLRVAGSNPVSRSSVFSSGADLPFVICAHVAQSVEHILGKDEVTSSILVVGSS